MRHDLLICIPTYDERENVGDLLNQILELQLPADVVFIDDNSPDGTGQLLDELASRHPNVSVIHRSGKLGIGSAHIDGIRYAYSKSYPMLLTMDCDFTHSPRNIRDFLAKSGEADIVVGSRYLDDNSLDDWNALRRTLTVAGHAATRLLLDMPYDATGAFRLYRLDRIPSYFLDAVHSRGYSFFFESLYVLKINGFRITEVSTRLPARTYGHSKMRLRDAFQSLGQLIHTKLTTIINRERFIVAEPFAPPLDETLVDSQDWNSYWSDKGNQKSLLVYDLIAAFYRKVIIRPSLNHFVRKYFTPGSKVLHAGCGSGQVDRDISNYVAISALDISAAALTIYKKANPHYRDLIYGSIFAMPVADNSFEGIYNLGVMEHFTEDEIHQILLEFRRALNPGGQMLLFWPPEYGLSVIFLKGVHFVLRRVFKSNVSLHPPELTRVRSRQQISGYLAKAGFTLKDYSFGIRDLLTYTVVVGEKLHGDEFVSVPRVRSGTGA